MIGGWVKGRIDGEVLVRDERVDMKGYKISASFRRQVTAFFKYWDKVVISKAKGRKSYIQDMEVFFGEILDKFEELDPKQQKECVSAEAPFKVLRELTNLSIPKVFPKDEDSDDFIEIFLSHSFKA